jgi:hypothetical protein
MIDTETSIRTDHAQMLRLVGGSVIMLGATTDAPTADDSANILQPSREVQAVRVVDTSVKKHGSGLLRSFTQSIRRSKRRPGPGPGAEAPLTPASALAEVFRKGSISLRGSSHRSAPSPPPLQRHHSTATTTGTAGKKPPRPQTPLRRRRTGGGSGCGPASSDPPPTLLEPAPANPFVPAGMFRRMGTMRQNTKCECVWCVVFLPIQ